MYCKNCGKEIDGNFCTNCGTPVAVSVSDFSKERENVKKDRFSKLIFIISLVVSVLVFFYSDFCIFFSSISTGDLDNPSIALALIGCTIPFSMAIFIGSSLRGKSKVASSFFYILSILSALFLCCLNLAFADDFLLSALLAIPFIVLVWIFGNRCSKKTISKPLLIIYAMIVIVTFVSLLIFFSGDIAFYRATNDFVEDFSHAAETLIYE